MKKSVCLLLCIVLSAMPLFGCSKEKDTSNLTLNQDTSLSQIQETIHPYIAELMDSLPEAEDPMPDQVIAETEKYTFYRKNQICYLSFRSGDQQIKYCLNNDEKSCVYPHGFSFDSMEELYQWLIAPEIDTVKEIAIRHAFLLDEENGFILPDPYRLYTIETPKGYTVTNVNLSVIGHRISYTNSNHQEFPNVCNFGLEFCNKAMFSRWLTHKYSHKTNACNNVHHHEEYDSENVSYVEWTNDDGSRSRSTYYVLETEDKTLFISEYARIHAPDDPSVTPEHPDRENTSVSTYSNGAYFSIWGYCPRSCDRKQDEDDMKLDLYKKLEVIHYVPTSPKH